MHSVSQRDIPRNFIIDLTIIQPPPLRHLWTQQPALSEFIRCVGLRGKGLSETVKTGIWEKERGPSHCSYTGEASRAQSLYVLCDSFPSTVKAGEFSACPLHISQQPLPLHKNSPWLSSFLPSALSGPGSLAPRSLSLPLPPKWPLMRMKLQTHCSHGGEMVHYWWSYETCVRRHGPSRSVTQGAAGAGAHRDFSPWAAKTTATEEWSAHTAWTSLFSGILNTCSLH